MDIDSIANSAVQAVIGSAGDAGLTGIDEFVFEEKAVKQAVADAEAAGLGMEDVVSVKLKASKLAQAHWQLQNDGRSYLGDEYDQLVQLVQLAAAKPDPEEKHSASGAEEKHSASACRRRTCSGRTAGREGARGHQRLGGHRSRWPAGRDRLQRRRYRAAAGSAAVRHPLGT